MCFMLQLVTLVNAPILSYYSNIMLTWEIRIENLLWLKKSGKNQKISILHVEG